MNLKNTILIFLVLLINNACVFIQQKQTLKYKEQKVKKRPYTTIHIFKAKLNKITYHICAANVIGCPEKCGASGDVAWFDVLEYKTLLVNGKAFNDKLKTYHVQLSDYYKKDINKEYVKLIRKLTISDTALIHTEYVYDTTLTIHRTVENIKKISKNKY